MQRADLLATIFVSSKYPPPHLLFLIHPPLPTTASTIVVQHLRLQTLLSVLAHSFYSVFVSVSVSMAFSTVFNSINSLDNSPLSHSVLLVLFCLIGPFNYISIYLYNYMEVSLSPDIILCGSRGSKHQIISYLNYPEETR